MQILSSPHVTRARDPGDRDHRIPLTFKKYLFKDFNEHETFNSCLSFPGSISLQGAVLHTGVTIPGLCP